MVIFSCTAVSKSISPLIYLVNIPSCNFYISIGVPQGKVGSVILEQRFAIFTCADSRKSVFWEREDLFRIPKLQYLFTSFSIPSNMAKIIMSSDFSNKLVSWITPLKMDQGYENGKWEKDRSYFKKSIHPYPTLSTNLTCSDITHDTSDMLERLNKVSALTRNSWKG